jgi:ubiquinone biosynthesis protein UbiJ
MTDRKDLLTNRINDVRHTIGELLTDIEEAYIGPMDLILVLAHVECLSLQVEFMREAVEKKRAS